ncbi:MAG: Ig domain protein group 2 domain protein [Gemmatimonadetes bacterium]|nr:Ig domain protein group 2 domain protein [Gemmatimonadota bacterium]
MQRVVRSTLVGLLTLAGLAACGDSTSPTPVVVGVVHSVTVSPSSVNLLIGGTATLAASVDADASITDRTVTWTSSDATVASVDATTGKVTGVKAGTVTITATSKANTSVAGAAVVTVAGNGNGAIPTVTISSINQTNAAGQSVPANLGNVAGQLDVVLNVDTNGGILKTVTATLKCGNDSIINTQTVSNVVSPVSPIAEAASAPVTLSFNTAQFSSAGVAALHNGTCTISAQAVTASGTQSATSSTTLTLNNADVLVGSIKSSLTATDAAGLAWNGGTVTVTVTPVAYTTGRTVASTSVTLTAGGVPHTQTVTGAGTQTVTFVDGNDGGSSSTNIDGVTDAAATVTVTSIDSNGQTFTNAGGVIFSSVANPLAPVVVPSFRLDTQKPTAGTFAVRNNAAQNTSANGYLNGSFRFVADSAAGYCGPNSTGYTPANAGTAAPVCTGKNTANLDNGGVDKVTVVFQTGVTASTVTFANTTTAANLNETTSTTGNTNSYTLRMITTDALGNADTSATQTFGVDKTAPSTFASTETAGPTTNAAYTTIGASNAGGQAYTTSPVTDNLSGPSIDPANGQVRVLVAQTRNWSGLNPAAYDVTTYEGKVYSNTTGSNAPSVATTDLSPCMIGRFNATAAKAGANALAAFDRAGTQMGFCTPVFFDVGAGAAGSIPPAADISAGSASTTGGYYKTEIITVDQAGNTSTPFVNTIVEDATNPVVSGADLPGSISGNTTVSVPASVTENVDVVGSWATVGYTGVGMNLRYPTTAGPGVAFDNVLTRTATVSPVITNFIRNLSQATGTTPTSSTTTANDAKNLNISAIDEVNRVGSLTGGAASLAPVSVGTETATTFSANFNAGYTLTANNNPIWNCPAATTGQTTGCGALGTSTPGATSTTLTATASGNTAVFNNPFSIVTFWYQNASGDWVQIGSSSTGVVSDNGTNRTWAYTFTWDPPATGADGTNLTPAAGGTINLPVRAIGVNSSGDAVSTATFTLTINNT